MVLFSLMACQSQSALTYATDIAPIVQGRCINCHQSGGIGALDFSDPESVQRLAPLIAQQVKTGAMPPWPATGAVSYDNDWSLSSEQIETIVTWADNGAPLGDMSDWLPPLRLSPEASVVPIQP